MTPSNILRRNVPDNSLIQENYHRQIESHRMRYAPHATNPHAGRISSNSSSMSRTPCQFRNRVYSHGLWVIPTPGNRIREFSPEFYKRNPACTHRLLPWLNRELAALLSNNETQVTFVLELIMALITRYEITSQEFFIHIEPYLTERTHHFVHELRNFAASPHDMETYDRISNYSGMTDRHSVIDEDNEVRIVDDGIARNRVANRTRGSIPLPKSLKRILIKKTAENRYETVVVPDSQNLSNPGPSTSSSNYISTLPDAEDDECRVLQVLKPRRERTPEVVDLSSDEEVFKASQTVVYNVPSDSDTSSSDSIPRFEFSPWRMIPRLLPSRKRSPLRCLNAGLSPPSSVSWSTKYPPSPDEYQTPSYMDSDGSSTDIECVYTTELASTSTAMLPHSEIGTSSKSPTIATESTVANVQDFSRCEPNEPSELTVSNVEVLSKREPKMKPSELTVSNVQDLSKRKPKKKSTVRYVQDSIKRESKKKSTQLSGSNNKDSIKRESKKKSTQLSGSNGQDSIENEPKKKSTKLSGSNVQDSIKREPKKKLSSAIVRPWAASAQTTPREASPKPSNSKRPASPSHLSDSSLSFDYTGSDSSRGPKKLKLRSVVAHFSYDSSDKRRDTSHRPSHKKHKDKKKKKKKRHLHRHKHRISSDSDSSQSS